jgi:hypothetical protein
MNITQRRTEMAGRQAPYLLGAKGAAEATR